VAILVHDKQQCKSNKKAVPIPPKSKSTPNRGLGKPITAYIIPLSDI